MTIVDDELLHGLFQSAGSAFAVPQSGVDDIVDLAGSRPATTAGGAGRTRPSGSDDGRGAPWSRRLSAALRSHRLVVGAACLVTAFVVAAGVGWIWKAPTTPRVTAVSAPSPAGSSQATRHGSGRVGATTTKGATATPVTGATGTGTTPTSAAGSSVSNGSAFGKTATSTAQTSTAQTSTAQTSTAQTTTGSAPPALPNGDVGQSSKIEQTGSLSLVVPKGATSKTMTELTALAGAYGGFVVSSSTQAGTGGAGTTLEGSITVQVPVNSFATVLKKAQALGRTSALTTKATDVTGKYVDLQSQITALEASLQQYLTIMTKATTIGDILSVQSQINTIQSQIQQLQGQLQLLTTETTYSTLTVLVNEKVHPVPVPPVHAESGLAKAWHDSVHGFLDALEGLIRLSLPALFVLVCGAAVVLGARLGWRRYRRATL